VTYSLDIATYREQMLAAIKATAPTLSITRTGNELQISWPDPGVAYNLQATSSFSPSSWAVINPPLTTTNGQIVATVPVSTGMRFFRLQSAASPGAEN